MKVPPQRQDAFLGAPDPAVVAILLFGPDSALVRERSEALVRRTAGSPPDPFRLTELTGAEVGRDPARLGDEAASQSLLGGRRVVRVRDAGNESASALEQALARPAGPTMLVLEAGDLPTRSALRLLCEGSARAAALGCYEAGPEALLREARTQIAAAGSGIDPEALDLLGTLLASDRQAVRREVEKLLLYAGDGARIREPDVRAAVGDGLEQTLDDAALSAGDGDPAGVERAVARLVAEGVSEVAVLRAAQRHLTRLHAAVLRVEGGQDADAAIAPLRLFYKIQGRMRAQLGRWNRARLEQALDRLVEAEAACKQTGAPAELLCSRAMIQAALLARRPARGA